MKSTLKQINDAAKRNPEGFINECDIEYSQEIAATAEHIAKDDNIKIVAIAGPSASGKTTTAHLMCRRLEELGERTAVLSLDDFYNLEENLPRLADGSADIESVYSLDIELIKKCFTEIIKTGSTVMPAYDFRTRTRIEDAKRLEIGGHGIVVVEGLHALNPVITDLVPRENIYKIYITVNRSVDGENGIQLLSSRQIRLVRRILRDEQFRGADVRETLLLWNNVIEGETKHLYPFKKTADIMFTTFHPYEICVYKERFCRLRDTVNRNVPWYDYFIKTANALEMFNEIPQSLVPENSLIREFIG